MEERKRREKAQKGTSIFAEVKSIEESVTLIECSGSRTATHACCKISRTHKMKKSVCKSVKRIAMSFESLEGATKRLSRFSFPSNRQKLSSAN